MLDAAEAISVAMGLRDEAPKLAAVDDLRLRAPGQSALAKADELRSAAPLRSGLDSELEQDTPEWRWRQGALSEMQVGAELDRLPRKRFLVLHDIPLGPDGTNVDHLVIGDCGVFSVNTKWRSGSVWLAEGALLVNGHATGLDDALREASRVSRCLREATGEHIVVQPVVALVAPNVNIRAQAHRVRVLACPDLRRWFEHQHPASLSFDRTRVWMCACRPATWRDG